MKFTLLTTIAAVCATAFVLADVDGGKRCKIGSSKPKDKCPSNQVCVPDAGKVGTCHVKCTTGTENPCPTGYLCTPFLPATPGGPGYCELDTCAIIDEKAKAGYTGSSEAMVSLYKTVYDDYYKKQFKNMVNDGYKPCVVNSKVMDEMCMKPGTFCFSADQEPDDIGLCIESAHWCTVGQKNACPGSLVCLGSTKATNGDTGFCVPKDAKKCAIGTENPCGDGMTCEELPGQDPDTVGAEGVCELSPCDGKGHDYWTFESWIFFNQCNNYYFGLPEEYQLAVKKAINDL